MRIPRKRLRWFSAALAVGTVLLLSNVIASFALAAPPLLSQFCPSGSGLGQCNVPRGVVANPTTGDIYLADQSNQRVQRFSAWGEFIGSWGSNGTGKGEFQSPQGVAIDSAGDIYVLDKNNHRVEKFTPDGVFLLMFGGEVDETTSANVCTGASGDTCGAGVEGTANGFFGTLAPGSYIAVGPGDKIYVGDQERIQVFNTSGAFVESIALPGEFVQSLAVDTDALSPSYGDLYVTYNALLQVSPPILSETEAKENVRKLSPTGALLGTLEVNNPRALATDPSNGNVYVMDRHPAKAPTPPTVQRFSATGKELETIDAEDFLESTGLATSAPKTCGLKGTDLIASSSEAAHSFVRIYGPPPDPEQMPAGKSGALDRRSIR